MDNFKNNFQLIRKMTIVDFKRKFKRSILGYFWLIAQPLLMILMYWFAFSSSNANQVVNINDVDYNWLVWVLIGCFTWTYFADILISGPSAVKIYFWMVKSYGIKPFIIIIFVNLSKFIVAIISITIAWIIAIIINATDNDPKTIPFSAKSLEIFIYFLFTIIFVFIYSFAFSNVFLISKDFQNLIILIPTFLSWMSAVFLLPNPNSGNEVVNVILQLNPFYFLINGYRAVILGYGDLFTFDYLYTWYSLLSFFIFIILLTLIGCFFHSRKRLKIILDITT